MGGGDFLLVLTCLCVFLCEVWRWKIDMDCNILRTEWLLILYRCSYNVLTLPVIYLIFIVKGGWAEPIYMPELWWFKAIISFDSRSVDRKLWQIGFAYNNSARALLVLPVDQHTHQLQWERRDIVALGIARCDYDSLFRYDENLTTATRWML